MKDFKTFQAILVLLFCADPTPLTAEDDKLVRAWANEEAKTFGFEDWIEAYHHPFFKDTTNSGGSQT